MSGPCILDNTSLGPQYFESAVSKELPATLINFMCITLSLCEIITDAPGVDGSLESR